MYSDGEFMQCHYRSSNVKLHVFSFYRVGGKCPFPSDLHAGRSCDYELHTVHRFIYIVHDWLLVNAFAFHCKVLVLGKI